jgi:hypothetical protein
VAVNWWKVLNIDGSLIARIDRLGGDFRFKSRYTILDPSNVEIGRIDNPRLGVEFVVYDREDSAMATGVLRGESTWAVERKDVPGHALAGDHCGLLPVHYMDETVTQLIR